MGLCMLVEVGGAVPGRGQLQGLLDAVYAAAMHQPAGLAFSGQLAPRINRALDRSVARHGIRRPGVLFLDPEAEETVWLASGSPLVLASSDRFRRRLDGAGIPFLETWSWRTAMTRRTDRGDGDRMLMGATAAAPPPPSFALERGPQR